MNEKLFKATSTFVDAMRYFEVAFIGQQFPNKKWEDVLYDRLKPQQQVAWNNRKQMLDDNADLRCLIDFDNMKGFTLGLKTELCNSGVLTFADVNSMATWLEDLQHTRNKMSHHNPIDEDETANAFYNMKRIAKLLGMTELVMELDHIQKKTQTVIAPQAAAPQQMVTTNASSTNDDAPIQPWFETVIPHFDIRNGSLDESVFAANLGEVALGTGQEVYINRTMFFEKTYVTAGLRDLANRVILALNGEETENRVISLQTGFGGGKTHSLISLYHIAKAGTDTLTSSYAANILNEGVEPKFNNAKVAVFTNNTTDVVQGRQPENGITIRTIWGELAYQLGGSSSYEIVRENDKQRIAPSGTLFKQILENAAPALILVDELADYCTKAAGVKVGNSTLSDQTIAFMQSLTETVASVRRCVLITTLPASATEIASSEVGQEILTALQNRVIRVGTSVTPVDDDEIFEVIRRRLFESIGDQSTIKVVVDRYRKYYNKRSSELPTHANNGTYAELIRKSYPFHPELIETFRQKWGQDSRFQRTRGVLRLLASIVNDLWKRRHSLVGAHGLIHTSDVNLSNVKTLTGQITNLKGTAWDSVLHADIIGSSSNSYRIDNEDPSSDLCKYSIAQGVATTIMLSSVAGLQNTGITQKELKLCMLRPGAYNHSEINNALSKLESVAHYMYVSNLADRRYRFESRPNVNILLTQAKNQITKVAIDAEIINRLQMLHLNNNTFNRIVIDPSCDMPDQKSLTLCIMGPDCVVSNDNKLSYNVSTKIKSLATEKGASPRIYRNTLLFLLSTETGYSMLTEKLKNYLACKKIQDEYGTLEKDQKEDIRDRKATYDKESEKALINAYTIVAKHTAAEGVVVLSTHVNTTNFYDHISNDILSELYEEEWVIRSIGKGILKSNNLFPDIDKAIKVRDIYDAFFRYDDKPMITGPQAVIDCVNKYCHEGAFNVANGEPGNWTKITVKGEIPFLNADDENTYLVDSTVVEKPSSSTGGSSVSGANSGTTTTGGTVSGGTGSASVAINGGSNSGTGMNSGTETQQPKRFKSVYIGGQIPMEHWTDLFGSFISTLRNNGLKIKVEFEATSTPLSEITENSPLYKSIKESASQLGLTFTTEEE
ncbi:ATP-binding protein [Prevotellamassilia timonensis]|uniref:ATP-binding protein n=1 Tax=Prevotellamassilia timonensis TaxID=1852370 RepID=UPI001F3D607B|nr:DUF499 domain-containing protein [Prevotellamassilia timonensis]MCF2635064.1 ATP-binding protein [Prevotellamassilia timonensis]